jgi:hypothetical protein
MFSLYDLNGINLIELYDFAGSARRQQDEGISSEAIPKPFTDCESFPILENNAKGSERLFRTQLRQFFLERGYFFYCHKSPLSIRPQGNQLALSNDRYAGARMEKSDRSSPDGNLYSSIYRKPVAARNNHLKWLERITIDSGIQFILKPELFCHPDYLGSNGYFSTSTSLNRSWSSGNGSASACLVA